MADSMENTTIESNGDSMHAEHSIGDRIAYENQLSLNATQMPPNERPTEIPAAKVSAHR